MEVINPTAEDFTVEYGKVPHALPAGEKRILPRYLADHVCKHLTNREILRKKSQHKDLNSDAVRNKWRDKIIIGVYQYYQKDKPMTEGEKIARQAELINKQYEDRLKKVEATVNAKRKDTKEPAGSAK